MPIVIIIALMIIGIFVFAWTKPNTISIQRVADIKATPEQIFELINNFRNWPAWSPQDKSDCTMKRTFGETASGQGATSEWTSKGRAGTGRMEMIESIAPVKITVKVELFKPFQACNINEFTLEPLDNMTRLTWAMRGTNPYLAKMMSIFVNMDRMMGKHFEAGLDSLKTLSE